MSDASAVTALHVASPPECSRWMALATREPDGKTETAGAMAVISLVIEARSVRGDAPSVLLFAVDSYGSSMLVRAFVAKDGSAHAVALGSTPEDAEMRAAVALDLLDEA